MKFYSCRINLGGSRENQVRKDKVSAPELMLLRELHDEEHVTEIAVVGEEDVDHIEERERLETVYPGDNVRKAMQALFGRSHIPLPEAAPSISGTELDPTPPKRGRPPKSAGTDMTA